MTKPTITTVEGELHYARTFDNIDEAQAMIDWNKARGKAAVCTHDRAGHHLYVQKGGWDGKKAKFQVTMWSKTITDSGLNEFRKSRHPEHEYRFGAYDDDDIFYCSGTVLDIYNDTHDELSVYLEQWGITRIEHYERKTGKRV